MAISKQAKRDKQKAAIKKIARKHGGIVIKSPDGSDDDGYRLLIEAEASNSAALAARLREEFGLVVHEGGQIEYHAGGTPPRPNADFNMLDVWLD